MEAEETPNFRVIDRRAAASGQKEQEVSPDTSQNTNETPQVEKAATTEAEEQSVPPPEMLLPLVALQMETRELVKGLVPIFDAHAWRALGLHANPKTGQTEENLPVAQLAIDCMQFFLEKSEAVLAEEELREWRRRLTDLRLNYIGRHKK